MNRFFTLLFAASCLTAFGQVTYPYNPDGNADNQIGISDLQDLLSGYGQYFELDSIYIDSIELHALLQSLVHRVNQLESMLFVNPEIPSYMMDLGDANLGDFILEPGQQNVLLESGSYGNIVIPEGASASILPHHTTVIRVAESFIVEGLIDGSGNYAGGGQGGTGNSVHLMANGGGSGGGQAGIYVPSYCPNLSHEAGSVSGFASEAFFPVNQLGGVTSGTLSSTIGALQVFPFLHGGDGGTSYYWSGGNVECGRPGGQGGGGIYVFAKNIDYSGELKLSGGDGQDCYQSSYGSFATGGGGGGHAVLCGEITNFIGSFDATGGSGGSCSNTPPNAMTPGGDGQNGELILLEW